MTTAVDRRDSRRLNQAVWLVLRRYGRQIARHPLIAVPALVLPGIGDVLVFYAPPLVVARLLGAVARNDALTMGMFTPYVLTFAALWFAGEVVWRGAEALIARAEVAGIQALYIEAMDELHASLWSHQSGGFLRLERKLDQFIDRYLPPLRQDPPEHPK